MGKGPRKNSSVILTDLAGKIRIKMKLHHVLQNRPSCNLFLKISFPSAHRNFNDSYSLQKTIAWEITELCFDFWGENFFPALSFLYTIFMIVWFQSTHSTFCYSIIGNDNQFLKFMILPAFFFLLEHMLRNLKCSLFSESANLKSVQIDNRNIKQNHIWLPIPTNHSSTSNGILL